MKSDSVSKTWQSEVWVVDRLVEAIEAGDGAEKAKLARHLLQTYEKHDWRNRRVVDAGVLVVNSRVDPTRADPQEVDETLEEHLQAARLAKIRRGAALSQPEILLWREHVIECEWERAADGDGNLWAVLEVKHSNRRRGYVAVRRWNGRSGVLVAACESSTDALRALRRLGVLRKD